MFLNHANSLIKAKARPVPINPLANWQPKFSIDVVFSKLNRIAERDVNVDPNDPNFDINLFLIEDKRKRNTDL